MAEQKRDYEGRYQGLTGSQSTNDDIMARDATERTPFLPKDIDSSTSEPTSPSSLSNRKPTPYVYALTFFAAIGGFLFGYDTGVISGAMLLLKSVFSLNSLWQEVIVAVTVGGAIIGSVIGGWSNDKYGRRPVLLAAGAIFTIGALLMGLAYHKEVLLAGRVTVGIGIGLASMTVPVYISEAAPADIRGTLVTINQLFITLGQFVASVIDGLFSTDTKNGWRYMLGIAGLPSLVMLIGFLFMPESPRWLVKNGNISKAHEVLNSLRGSNDNEEELDAIIKSCQLAKLQEKSGSTIDTYKRSMSTFYTRRALIVGCGLQAIQQLSGINTVMYYSATIIAMAGVRNQSEAIWMAAAVASANFIFTLLSLWLVDVAGRRKLTLYSLAGVVVGLALMGGSFYLMKVKSLPVEAILTSDQCSIYTTCFDCVGNTKCGFCYSASSAFNNTCLALKSGPSSGRPSLCPTEAPGNVTATWIVEGCPSRFSWLALLSMVFYLAMFASGMGPMAWVVNAEIYPLWARSVGNASSTATNWFFNLFVSLTFLHLMEYLTHAGTFLLYTCLSFAGWVFLFIFLPESKGVPLEEVENLFKGSPLIPCKKSQERVGDQ